MTRRSRADVSTDADASTNVLGPSPCVVCGHSGVSRRRAGVIRVCHVSAYCQIWHFSADRAVLEVGWLQPLEEGRSPGPWAGAKLVYGLGAIVNLRLNCQLFVGLETRDWGLHVPRPQFPLNSPVGSQDSGRMWINQPTTIFFFFVEFVSFTLVLIASQIIFPILPTNDDLCSTCFAINPIYLCWPISR